MRRGKGEEGPFQIRHTITKSNRQEKKNLNQMNKHNKREWMRGEKGMREGEK